MKRQRNSAFGAMLAPFSVRSFKNQWLGDLSTSWAFEMEVLILGWYVLVESKSVIVLVVYGSLQYMGSLVSPFIGVAGDRVGYRTLFLVARSVYAVLAVTVMILAATDQLTPLVVLLVSAVSGLFRPSDVMMRFSLVAQTMPAHQLIGALGTSRLTIDSARLVGSLAGVGVFAAFGIIWAYAVVICLYLISLYFTRGIARFQLPANAPTGGRRISALADLCSGFGHVMSTPPLLGMLCVAFLVNVLAYPLMQGLLPYVANNVYESGQSGLAVLGAAYAFGGLLGSLILSAYTFKTGPARLCLITCFTWFLLSFFFGLIRLEGVGLLLVFSIGLLQSVCMTPLAGVMLRASQPDYRGRVMGMRILAIFGLPIGLVSSGPLIEQLGFSGMVSLYSVLGMALCVFIGCRWRAYLWNKAAIVNTTENLCS